MSNNFTDRINGVLSSLAVKAPCLYATTANIALSGLSTRAGGPWASALTAGDRVLVTSQTDATENGIYDADSSDWSRSKDFDGNRDVAQGTRVPVVTDSAYAGVFYEVTTESPITIGTSEINFTVSTGDASALSVTATGASSARSLADHFSDHKSVADDGAVVDGVTDDAAALNLVTGAASVGGGQALVGQSISMSAARFFRGTMPPGTNPQSAGTPTQSYVVHNFDGHCFDFVGNTNAQAGAGGGLENLSIVQTHGDGTGESGRAINIVADATKAATWLKFNNVNIEETSGKNGWEWGVYVDGSLFATKIRNLWFNAMRIVAGTLSTGAMAFRGVANVFISNSQANLTNATLDLDGGSESVFVCNSTYGSLSIDTAQYINVIGGAFSDITTTSNSSDVTITGTNVTNGAPTLGGNRCYFVGADLTNQVYLFSSSGSNYRFAPGGGRTEFIGVNAVADDYQIIAEGRYNGYGAGIALTSRTSAAGERKIMAALVANGTDAFNTTASTQDAEASIMTIQDGTLARAAKFQRVATAGMTGFWLWDADNNQIEQVSVGAADSGGAGYKLLRIAN